MATDRTNTYQGTPASYMAGLALVVAFAGSGTAADAQVQRLASGLPLVFERNTGRYDSRARFIARAGAATIFLTDTGAVMLLPGKAGEKLRAESGEPRAQSPEARGERQEVSGQRLGASGATAVPSPRLRGEGQGEGLGSSIAKSSEPRSGGAEGSLVPTMNRRAVETNPASAGWEPNRRRSVSSAQTGDSSPGHGGRLSDLKSQISDRGPSALSPQPSADRHVLRMNLVGAKPGKAIASGLERQPGIVNYLIGNDPRRWRTNVPTYAKARLAGVYPGVDVIYYGQEPRGERQEARGEKQKVRGTAQVPSPRKRGEGQGEGLNSPSALSPQLSALEYDFIVHPGAAPSCIRLAFEGAERIRVANGDLILSTPSGDVRMKRPYAYQTIGGKRVQVACDYKLHSPLATHHSPRVAFRLAKYDTTRPLVVDPILEFSTYLGGTDDDGSKGIAVDGSGNVYVTGHTYGADFPTTPGAYNTGPNGDLDLFVVKLSPSGGSLVYGTYLGGSNWDHCHALAVDAAGNAHLAGETVSSDFPTSLTAYQTSLNGTDGDVFVAKLSPDGSTLMYGTYLGGSAWDCAYAVALDSSGNACIGGYAQSTDWPTTAGAFSTTHSGAASDAVVAKLSLDGSSLVCSSYLGGSGEEYAMGVAVDSSGNIAVAGLTTSANFPTTTGALATSYAGGDSDGFVGKLNADATAMLYGTYIGGSGTDAAYGVAVAASGKLCASGETQSADFPVTAGAYDTTLAGVSDGFVLRLNAVGDALDYSTYVGGSASDAPAALALDASDRAWITGYTFSTDYPVTPNAFDSTLASGDLDAFVTLVSTDGSALVFSSYAGGSGSDNALAIAAVGADGACVAGSTWSSDFPTTAGAFDTTANGNGEGFALRVTLPTVQDTTLWTIDRVGTITELVILRQFDLMRVSDQALLEGRTIAYKVDGTQVGAAITNAGGDSTLSWTVTDGPATRTLTVEFAGDASHNGSSADATLTAQTHDTKTFGVDRDGKITAYRILKAWLYRLDNTPVIGKALTFKLDGTVLGTDTTRSTGLAQIGYTIADGAGAGTREIRAEWPGDGGYRSSYGINTLTVSKATPYIWVMPRTVPLGGVARFYAYFRRLADYQKQEGKTLTFRVDGTFIVNATTGSGGDAGIARYSYTTVEPIGDHVIRCEFAGDPWVEAGFGEATLRIY